MSKVIFFIRPMYGHVNPTLDLVKELVQRGEEVIYYTTEVFQETIQRTGATCRLYKDSGSRLNMGGEPNLNPEFDKQEIDFQQQVQNVFADFAVRMEDVWTQEQDLREEIIAENPAYIIYDYIDAFWGKMLAQKLGIPAIASINTFAFCPQMIEKDPISVVKFILHMSPDAPPFKDNSINVKDLVDFISIKIGSIYNIKNFHILNFGNSELLNIAYNSQYFQPYGEVFNETFAFVGFSIGERIETTPFPFECLNGRRLIYISLGTNYNQNLNFYQKCFETFEKTDNQVVLSVGTKIELKVLGSIPSNFIVKPYVPQQEILKRASVFITHGGINSINESIYYNVPFIVFPQQGDQFAVSHQVSHLGAGICFENSNITKSELREAVKEVCSNNFFSQNRQKINESFTRGGGVAYAADEIFKLKERLTIH